MSGSLPHKSSTSPQDRPVLLESAGPYAWKMTSPKNTVKEDRGWVEGGVARHCETPPTAWAALTQEVTQSNESSCYDCLAINETGKYESS